MRAGNFRGLSGLWKEALAYLVPPVSVVLACVLFDLPGSVFVRASRLPDVAGARDKVGGSEHVDPGVCCPGGSAESGSFTAPFAGELVLKMVGW